MKGLMKAFSQWRGWRMIVLSREYVEECAGSHSVGRLWKRWIETEGLLLQEWCEWWGFVRENVRGVAWGMNP